MPHAPDSSDTRTVSQVNIPGSYPAEVAVTATPEGPGQPVTFCFCALDCGRGWVVKPRAAKLLIGFLLPSLMALFGMARKDK